MKFNIVMFTRGKQAIIIRISKFPSSQIAISFHGKSFNGKHRVFNAFACCWWYRFPASQSLHVSVISSQISTHFMIYHRGTICTFCYIGIYCYQSVPGDVRETTLYILHPLMSHCHLQEMFFAGVEASSGNVYQTSPRYLSSGAIF